MFLNGDFGESTSAETWRLRRPCSPPWGSSAHSTTCWTPSQPRYWSIPHQAKTQAKVLTRSKPDQSPVKVLTHSKPRQNPGHLLSTKIQLSFFYFLHQKLTGGFLATQVSNFLWGSVGRTNFPLFVGVSSSPVSVVSCIVGQTCPTGVERFKSTCWTGTS